VQWHTGRELTADDVAWNIKRVSSDPKVAGGGFYNWMSQTLTGIETSEKYTVVLKADRSWPAVFDTLSLLSMIDPVTFDRLHQRNAASGSDAAEFWGPRSWGARRTLEPG
jgi:ABC-type transport system substrate-binding protein